MTGGPAPKSLALGVAGFLYVGRAPLLCMADGWLVIHDPLCPPAGAIVVVAGGTPFDEAAAGLFKQGLAPRVILSRAAMSEGHVALMELGIRPLDSQAEAREPSCATASPSPSSSPSGSSLGSRRQNLARYNATSEWTRLQEVWLG